MGSLTTFPRGQASKKNGRYFVRDVLFPWAPPNRFRRPSKKDVSHEIPSIFGHFLAWVGGGNETRQTEATGSETMRRCHEFGSRGPCVRAAAAKGKVPRPVGCVGTSKRTGGACRAKGGSAETALEAKLAQAKGKVVVVDNYDSFTYNLCQVSALRGFRQPFRAHADFYSVRASLPLPDSQLDSVLCPSERARANSTLARSRRSTSSSRTTR